MNLTLLGPLIETVVTVLLIILPTGFVLFRYVGRKWIDARFDKAMEDFRHQNQLQIEILKGSVQGHVNRLSKLHSLEFETLTETNRLLAEAVGLVANSISPMQRYPNISRLPDDDLPKTLEKLGLDTEIIEKISQEPNLIKRQSFLWESMDLMESQKAYKSCVDLHSYLLQKSIFIEKSISDRLQNITNMMIRAMQEKFQRFATDPPYQSTEQGKFREQYSALKSDLDDAIRKRIWEDIDAK